MYYLQDASAGGTLKVRVMAVPVQFGVRSLALFGSVVLRGSARAPLRHREANGRASARWTSNWIRTVRQEVERRRSVGGASRSRVRELPPQAPTRPALTGATAHDPRGHRLQAAGILARRHAHEYLLDDAPIQRVLPRQRLEGWQRHLAPRGAHARADVHSAARRGSSDPLPARPRPRGGPSAPRSNRSAFVSTRSSTSGRDRTVGVSTTTDGRAVRDCFMAAPVR